MSETNPLACLTSYGAESVDSAWYLKEVQVTKTKLHPATHTLDQEKCQRTEQKVFHHAKLEVFSPVRNLHVSVLSATPIFEAIAQLPCLNWIFFQHSLQADELMHFRVPPTLWIACVYCIWTVINITLYYFVTYLQKKVNGFNAALYSLDVAKNRQEFAVCLKARYLTYWRACLSKMRHRVLIQKEVTWRWST